jgi:anaphase-promoting complex subunit 3
MAPNPAAAGCVLRQVIHYHLDNASYDNALFFSERFVAQEPKSTEATYLAALSHLRLRDFRSAYDVSKPIGYRGVHLGCAWVFAQACLALERHKDGICALEKSKALWPLKLGIGKHSATSRAPQPDASVLYTLLGKLHRGLDDKKKAVSCFEEALKMNPFMFDAFTMLCDMGVSVRVPNVFRSSDNLLQCFSQENQAYDMKETTAATQELLQKKGSAKQGAEWMGDPFTLSSVSSEITGSDVDPFSEPSQSDFLSKIQAARMRWKSSTNGQPAGEAREGPVASASAESVPLRSSTSQEPPQAPPRRARTAHAVDSGLEAPPRMNYRLGVKKTTREKEPGGLTRAVVDIFHQDADVANTSSEKATSIPAVERKRTVSGQPVPRSMNLDDPGTRRSARLNTFKPSVKVNSGAATIGASAGRELKKARPQISRIVRPGSSSSNVGRVVSGNRKPVEDRGTADAGEASRPKESNPQPAVVKSAEPDTAKIEEALKWTLDLTKRLANGYYHLSRFQCDEALQALSSLPAAHQGTPWVLALMGRAHYEQASYPEAEKFFRKMRVQAQSRLQDMEVYSTILWHLKRETDLSFLAHELVDSAWHSPQAWCALGNAWSLARDPEQALRCFKRATQLDPKFAYAFTLQGHEHVANEEYDKALTAYRQAIAADRRHYNAYYGIGRVQERLGAYDKAYTHFHAAQAINPNNAVLICCIGTVLEKQKQIVPALQAYTKAAELAPRAAQTRYKKARALLAVGQVDAAHRELMILKDLAPDEGTVHFLLGTLYRTLNDKQSAVRHFTIALALDPKVSRHRWEQL